MNEWRLIQSGQGSLTRPPSSWASSTLVSMVSTETIASDRQMCTVILCFSYRRSNYSTPFSSFPALDLDYSNGTYGALLDLIDKFFDPDYNIEQQTFEECCRYIFGTEAYILFTIDKLVSALIKQVRADGGFFNIWLQFSAHVLTPSTVRFKLCLMIQNLQSWSSYSRAIVIWKAPLLDSYLFTD